MAGVEDQRLPAAQVVMEQTRQPQVPALGHARRLLGGRALLGIEVDVEVLGLQHLELEGLVLDLVAPEVLRRGGTDARRQNRDREQQAGSGMEPWCTPGSSLPVTEPPRGEMTPVAGGRRRPAVRSGR